MKTESLKNNLDTEKTDKCCDHTNKSKNPLIRFFKWWLIFTGLYSAAAACPFCGNMGCPVGLGSTGAVGAFLALFMQNWKNLFHSIWVKMTRLRFVFNKRGNIRNEGSGYRSIK